MKRRCGPLYILKPLCLGASRRSTFGIICHVCFDTRGWRLPDQQLDSGEGRKYSLTSGATYSFFFIYMCALMYQCARSCRLTEYMKIYPVTRGFEYVNMFFDFYFLKTASKTASNRGTLIPNMISLAIYYYPQVFRRYGGQFVLKGQRWHVVFGKTNKQKNQTKEASIKFPSRKLHFWD